MSTEGGSTQVHKVYKKGHTLSKGKKKEKKGDIS